MGLEFLNAIAAKKKLKKLAQEEQQLPVAEVELAPHYEDGYNAENNTIVRLISRRRPKKAYQVSGLDDVASKNNWKGWLYLAPVLILISVFLLYPLVNTIVIAFTKDYNYFTNTGSGFTLKNFGIIFGLATHTTATGQTAKETAFMQYAVVNTLIITFVTVPLSIFIALIISVALNSLKWFQKFLQTVFFLPYVTNTLAIGMVFAVIFDKQGIINSIFGLNGIDSTGSVTYLDWIRGGNRWLAFIPLCIYIVWNSIPFKILILLSGLQGIDKQYYQAAQIDAAPRWKVLMKITVPLLSPQILYLMITSFIGAFKEYTSIVAMFNGPSSSGGGTKDMYTIVYYVYENIQAHTDYAAAGAVFLFVIILLFTLVQFKVSKTRVHY